MKKTVLLVLCIALPNLILACGCDMLIAYQGILPSDYNGNIGLNMRQRYFKGAASTHNHSDGSAHEHGQMKQLLTNYELNYRFFITRKIMLSGNLPVADYQLSSSKAAATSRNTGIGDPFVVAKYEIISPSKKEEVKNKHRLLIGTGVKLPLGTYYKDMLNNLPADENLLQLQLGTGSFDWIAHVNYQLKYKNAGLQTDVSFKKNFANKAGFEKGNQLNAQSNYFYQKRGQKSVFMPFIGALYENALSDNINNSVLINTGGSNLYGNFGAEFFMKKISIYFNYQQLLSQALNGFQMKNNLRFTIGINYNLNYKNTKN
jgi:hypothetical protein